MYFQIQFFIDLSMFTYLRIYVHELIYFFDDLTVSWIQEYIEYFICTCLITLMYALALLQCAMWMCSGIKEKSVKIKIYKFCFRNVYFHSVLRYNFFKIIRSCVLWPHVTPLYWCLYVNGTSFEKDFTLPL